MSGPKPTGVEPLWTVAEVAGYLQVPVKTIYNWRSEGVDSPPAHRVGKHLRFEPDEVRAWVQRRAA